ncbi:Heme/hemopexin-binding protein [Thalassocella blandensis]|nr:Heme/hemopexin-binding protein [Thalassocella blandensis]
MPRGARSSRINSINAKPPSVFIKPITPLLISASVLAASQAWAGPEGGTVTGGTGSITQAGNATTILQNSDRMSIDWTSYNLNSDERVQYIQPDSNSVSLNRIMSNSGSHIQGRIDANGQVILMNPNGIFFGENSVVNAGGIMATGLSIDADDFMNGDFTFLAIEGTDGIVINSGVLNAATGGSVALVGKQVKNEGLIKANLGAMTLAAGREAVMSFDAEGLIRVRISKELLEEDIGVDAAVINEGTIQGEDGQVLLTASVSEDIFTQAMNTGDMQYDGSVVVRDDGSFVLGGGADVVNHGTVDVSGALGGTAIVLGENIEHSGVINATSLQGNSQSRIEIHSRDKTLLSDESTVIANAENGNAGDIKILGDKVGLIGQAKIEASGATGGGRILIGGDQRGQNIEVRNASQVFVGGDVIINSDALESGDAGNIVLWGTDSLRAFGTLNARGFGSASGGFIETSSHVVDLDLNVNVEGAGLGGEWLIDPWNITIGTVANEIEQGLQGDEYVFSPNSPRDDVSDTGDSVVRINGLLNALTNNATVKIETGPDIDVGVSGQVGNITLSTDLNFNNIGSSTLILNAHNDIFINNRITDSSLSSNDSLNLDLKAGGDVFIKEGITIDTRGGYFAVEGVDFTLGSTLSGATTITTNGGNVTLNNTGAVKLYGDITTNGGAFTVGSTASRAASFTSAWDLDSDASTIYETIATINTSTTSTRRGHVKIYTTGDIRFGAIDVGSHYVNSGGSTNTLDIFLDSNANIFQESWVDVNSGMSSFGYLTNYTLNANGNITFGKDSVYDNGSGPRLHNPSHVIIKANRDNLDGGDVKLAGDRRTGETADANIYSGGIMEVSGHNLTIGGTNLYGQLNAEGGDISINMTGAISLYDNYSSWEPGTLDPSWSREGESAIKSYNGNISVTGSSFTANGLYSINTEGYLTASGTPRPSSAVTITTTNGNAVLGTIKTSETDATDSVNSDLIVNANGNITQGSGSLSVSGETVLNADQDNNGLNVGNITLNSASNKFSRGILIQRGNNVTLRSTNDINFVSYDLDGDGGPLAATTMSTIDGSLTVTSVSGDITDDSSIKVSGTSSFSATDLISFDNTNNDFIGAVSANADEVTLVDANNIELGVITIKQDAVNSSSTPYTLSVTAGGNITDSATSVITASAGTYSTHGPRLVLTAGTQSDPGNISLLGDHNLNRVIIPNAYDVTINDIAGGIILGDRSGTNGISSSILHSLYVTTTGNSFHDGDGGGTGATDTGQINVAGSTTIINHGNQVNLNTSHNSWGDLSIDSSAESGNDDGGEIIVSSAEVSAVNLNSKASGSGTSGTIEIIIKNSFTQKGLIQGGDVTVTGNNDVNIFNFNAGSSHDATSFTVSALGENDVFNFYGNVGTSTSNTNLDGEGGSDTYNLMASGISIYGIDGGGSNDTIVGYGDSDHINTWTSSGNNQGSVLNNSGNVAFENIENLHGGSEKDDMTISHQFNEVFGGVGEDIIRVVSGANVSNLLGGTSDTDADDDTLVGFIGGANWEIGTDSGTIYSISKSDDSNTQNFSGFEILQGQGNVDTFILSNTNFTGEVRGGAGADIFNIQAQGLSFSIHGNDGVTADSDVDTINGFDAVSSWNFGIDNSGTIEDSNQLIVVTGDIRFDEIDVVQGNGNEDTFNFYQEFSGEVKGGAGDDFFNFYASPSTSLPASPIILGEAGSDTFTLMAADVEISVDGDGISGGSTGTDTLVGFNGINTWNIGLESDTTETTLQLVSEVTSGGTTTEYTSNFANMDVLQGGSRADTFEARRDFTGRLLGGDGNDVFNLYASVSDANVSTAYDVQGEGGEDNFYLMSASVTTTIDGGSEATDNDTIHGFAIETVWNITDEDLGNIDFSGDTVSEITFNEIENLVGPDNVKDSFAYGVDGQISGQITGGDGAVIDTIDYSNAGAQNLVLGSAGFGGINGIEELKASDAEGITNFLSGGTTDFTQWVINGIYDGQVTSSDGLTTITFTNFHVLTGTDKNDTFDFVSNTAQMRRIYGGNGTDWVSYAKTTDVKTIYVDNARSLTDTVASHGNNRLGDIEWVIGNSSGSTINFYSNDNEAVNWTIGDFDDTTINPFGDGTSVIVVDGASDGNITHGTSSLSFVNFGNLVGGNGDDNFEFLEIAGIVSISGGDEEFLDIDTLEGRAVNTTWTISGPNSGTVDWGSDSTNDFSFSSIENLVGQDEVLDNFIFTQPSVDQIGSISGSIVAGGGVDASGNTIIDVVDFSSVNAGRTIEIGGTVYGISGAEKIIANKDYANSITGNSTFYRWFIGNATGEATLDDGVNDGVVFNGDGTSSIQFINFQTLIGSDANDEFTVNSGTINTIRGGAGNNALTGKNVDSTWTIDGENSGKVTAGGAEYVSSFSEIYTLTGAETFSDSFNVESTGMFTGRINGGSAGSDHLTVSTPTAATHPLHRENEWQFVTNAGITTTTVGRVNQSNVKSSIITFTGMEELTGGTGNDVFEFNSFTDFSAISINAGVDSNTAVSDRMDLSNLSTDETNKIEVKWTGSSIVAANNDTNFVSINGIEFLTGNDADNLTLMTPALGANTWTIDAANGGRVSNTVAARNLNFASVNNLVGNDFADTFTITDTGSFDGHLDGGEGTGNKLTWTVGGNIWSLGDAAHSGQVANTEFEGIQTLTGNNTNDTLVGRNQINKWVINGQNDGYVELNETGGDRMNFVDMANVSGNIQTDYFLLSANGNVSGMIRGVFTGGSDTATDHLSVASTNSQRVEWSIANGVDGAGNATGSVKTTNFSGIESFVGGDGQDVFTIGANAITASISGGANAEAAFDTIKIEHSEDTIWTLNGDTLGELFTFGSSSIHFNGVEQIDGSGGRDTFTISAVTDVNLINSLGGNDVITVNTGGDVAMINTGTGNDEVNIGNASLNATVDLGVEDGDGGKDKITLTHTNDVEWVFNNGVAPNIQVSGGGTVSVTNAEVYEGGGGSDTFKVGSAVSLDTLRGGNGNDVFELSENAFVQTIAGMGGVDTLYAKSTAETSAGSGDFLVWNITGSNSGNIETRLSNFSGIENLTGGAGQDRFVFANTSAVISGLIDGGESGQTNDVNYDEMDLQALINGVVVEIGPIALPGSVVVEYDTTALTNVNVNNVEKIVAANHPDTSNPNDHLENNNYLAITHDNDFILNMDDVTPNNGYTQEGTDIHAAEDNTRVVFENFGRLQGGNGAVEDDMREGNPTGGYIAGDGPVTKNYSSIDGLVVVELTERLVKVIGNGNTLIRIAEEGSSNGIFNGDNIWDITNSWLMNDSSGDTDYAISGFSGSMNASYVEDHVFSFSGVSMLQGGAGDDEFRFTNSAATNLSRISALVNGAINGGGGTNTVVVQSAPADLAFGLSQVSTTAVPAEDIEQTFPGTLSGPVYLVNNREGIIDLANIAELRVESGATTNESEVSLISGSTGSYAWNIVSSDEQYVSFDGDASSMLFSGVDRIGGGTASDVFNISALGLVANDIDGGGGSGYDVLNLVNVEQAITFTLKGVTDANQFRLSNIEDLQTSIAEHRLIADDLVNNWFIDEENKGRIEFTTGDENQSLRFNSVHHLVGGSSRDTFRINDKGRLSGTIDGGGQAALGDQLIINSNVTQAFTAYIGEKDSLGNVVDANADQLDISGVEVIQAENSVSDSGEDILHTLVARSNVNNRWTINASNASLLTGTDTIDFSGFDHLIGGAAQDTFIFNGRIVAGLIDGGSHASTAADSITITGINNHTVQIGQQSSYARDDNLVNVVNVESLNVSGENLTLAGNNLQNRWNINAPTTSTSHRLKQTLADGSEAVISFGGFSALRGGSSQDNFFINANSAIGLISSINGGGGDDSLDLQPLTTAVSVSRDQNYDADYLITSIETLIADDIGHTLIGGNTAANRWVITNSNAGSITESGLTTNFSGFANVLGRDQVDVFRFEEKEIDGQIVTGKISGIVNGGGQPAGARDQVDMSDLSQAVVIIGDTTSDFTDIESYVGKGNSSAITGSNVENTWTITDTNRGTIVDASGNDIEFIGFGILNGGNVRDTFIFAGGDIGGEINAGGGRDSLTLNLGSGLTGGVVFNGGADQDTVTIIGGSAENKFISSYQPNSDGSVGVTFDRTQADGNHLVYDIRYRDTETINDQVFTSELTVGQVEDQADTITLSNNAFKINDLAEVSITNKDGFVVNGELAIGGSPVDHLIIDGRLRVNGSVDINNVSFETQGANAGIVANNFIRFNNTSGIGESESQRLNIQTANLVLNNPNGDVFLSQTGDLVISGLNSSNGITDIVSTGNISSAGGLNATDELRLDSAGDIELLGANSLSGRISLEGTNIVLHNNNTTNLGEVQAQNLSMTLAGNLTAFGNVAVTNSFELTGNNANVVNFAVENAEYRFNQIHIGNVGSFFLNDVSNNGVVIDSNVGGQRLETARDAFEVTALGTISANNLSAKDIALTSVNGDIALQSLIQARNSVALSGGQVNITGGINVTESTAELAVNIAARDNVNIRSSITANDILAGNISVTGQTILQANGAQISGQDVRLVSRSSIQQQENITATRDLMIEAATTFEMASDARSEASNLVLNAGGNITLDEIVAETASITSGSGALVLRDDIESGDLTMSATQGSIDVVSGADITFTQNLQVDARSATISGNIQSVEGAAIFDVENMFLLNSIIAAGSVDISAGQDFAMNSGVTNGATSGIRSQVSTVVNAGGNIQLTQINGQQGSVALYSGGAITDHNADVVNIIANDFIATTETGFGSYEETGMLETRVSSIDVRNNRGTSGVGISNEGDLVVNAIITNAGDIRLHNRGDVTLANPLTSGTYDLSAIDNDIRQAGGVIDAHYGHGNMVLQIEGSLGATPREANYERPELIGETVDVSTTEGFGVGGRPIVVYARKELIIQGFGIKPIWGFRVPPEDGLTTDGDLIDPSIVGSVSELLINVEPAEDIDPAVFTDVRNYSHDNIAIRMPIDQLYDDELEEDDVY